MSQDGKTEKEIKDSLKGTEKPNGPDVREVHPDRGGDHKGTTGSGLKSGLTPAADKKPQP